MKNTINKIMDRAANDVARYINRAKHFVHNIGAKRDAAKEAATTMLAKPQVKRTGAIIGAVGGAAIGTGIFLLRRRKAAKG